MSDLQPGALAGQPSQPQWIAAQPPPPPTPFGGSGAPRPRPGRGLAITAMALGLIALLTALISALYFGYGVIVAGVFGLAAIVIGIAALAKKQRLRQASIVGITTGILAVAASAVLGVMMLTGQMATAGVDSGSQNSDQSSSDSSQSADESDSKWQDEEPESLVEWPANMGTGGIRFIAGTEGPVAARSDAVAAGESPEAAQVDRENGPADILLYVDYRCPHCVDFDAENAKKFEQLVQSGAATLEIRPLSFVSPFSASAANAVACVTDSRPEAAWKAHLAVMDRSAQQISDTVALARLIDSTLDGIDDRLRSCVEDGRFTPLLGGLSQWYLASPIPYAIDPGLKVRGTPLAVVNGVAYTGDPGNGAEFDAFLAELGL